MKKSLREKQKFIGMIEDDSPANNINAIPSEQQRISLEKCKQILDALKNGLTDEQVLQIRGFLYKVAAIDYRCYMENLAQKLLLVK